MAQRDAETLPRADRLTIRVMATIAGMISAGALIFGTWSTIDRVVGFSPVALLVNGTPLDVQSPLVRSASVESAVVAADLAVGTRWLFAGGTALGALTVAVVAAAIAVALGRIAEGRPFDAAVSRAAIACGVAITIGGLLSSAVGGFAQMVAADELNGGPDGDGPFLVGFEFEPGPWLAGFAILALTAVFRVGARLQRDTEGLV